MEIYDLILKQLKASEKFRLIAVKENVLNQAVHSLCIYTTDIYEHLDVFKEIESSISLDKVLGKDLTSLNIELTNTDDFKIPLGVEIEDLCQKIRELGPHEDTEVRFWDEKIPLDKLLFSESESLKEVFTRCTDYIRHNEKAIFSEYISYFKQNEIEKESLIQQLEKELAPIKNLAEKLLEIEEIDNEWGSKLQDIIDVELYENYFYRYFISDRANILAKHSEGLNDLEKSELSYFFDELCHELPVL
jgi:hypothetical protein